MRPRSVLDDDTPFLIDADCIIGLENAHDDPPNGPPGYKYPRHEQDAIWRGLQQLAEQGRLRVLPEVIEEVNVKTPDGANRLKKLPRTTVSRTTAIMQGYQELITRYPGWATDEHDIRDKADPWIVATARVKKYRVLTDEIGARARRSRTRRGTPALPDVCAREVNVACFSGLRELARQSGWLDSRKASA